MLELEHPSQKHAERQGRLTLKAACQTVLMAKIHEVQTGTSGCCEDGELCVAAGRR